MGKLPYTSAIWSGDKRSATRPWHSRDRVERHTAYPAARMDGSKQARCFRVSRTSESVVRTSAPSGATGQDAIGHQAVGGNGGGVLELRERFDGNAFRTVYVVSLRKAVYVLHAFMKKSKSGIALPKPDAELIKTRLKHARMLDAED